MTEQEIRADFKKAFDSVENGARLSGKLNWGFSDEDISNLAKLHKKYPEYREKIYDLLEDCNFHKENDDFEKGNYSPYIIPGKERNQPKFTDIDEKKQYQDAYTMPQENASGSKFVSLGNYSIDIYLCEDGKYNAEMKHNGLTESYNDISLDDIKELFGASVEQAVENGIDEPDLD